MCIEVNNSVMTIATEFMNRYSMISPLIFGVVSKQ